jgi:hypothetical protein
VRSPQRTVLGPFLSAQWVSEFLRSPGGRFCRSLGPIQTGPICSLHAAGACLCGKTSLAAELDLKPIAALYCRLLWLSHVLLQISRRTSVRKGGLLHPLE